MPESLAHALGRRLGGHIETLLALVIIVLSLLLAALTPYFMTLSNWVDLIESYSVTGLFALGLFVVLVAGGIDISFTATASVAQYVTAVLCTRHGVPGAVGLPLCLAIGLVLGCLNGAMIHYLRVTSIIITIATLNVYFALLMYFSEGKLIATLPEWWSAPIVFVQVVTASGDVVRLTMPIVVLAVAAAGTWWLMNATGAGRQLYAMGGNPEAARRAGVNIAAMHFLAYGFLGLMAGLAGLVQAHRVGESVPNALFGGELNVLAAAVLGGTSLMGGIGTVPGVLLGILLLAILQNGLNLLGVSPYFFQIVIGIVILAATTFTMLKFAQQRRVAKGAATSHA